MRSRLHASLALLAVIVHSTASYARTYSVKKGDTLSQIAGRELSRPVYGSKGSLKKILDKNPDIQNPDRIYPKQIIRLEDDAIVNQPAPVETSPAPVASQPPAEPVADTAGQAGSESQAKFGVKLGVGVSKDELEAHDHERNFKSILDSRQQAVIDLDVYYKPWANTRLGLSVAAKNGDFADEGNGRFKGKRSQLHKLSLFADTLLANRWHLGAELGTEQGFYFVQRSAATFGLDEVFVDFAGVSAGFDIIATDSWRWGLLIDGRYLASAEAETTNIEKGSEYGAGTKLGYRWNSGVSLEGTLRYGRQTQGAEGIRQKMTEREGEIAVRYEF
ncbi:MAG: LysM peptidoglycan-binding domain-containing protein [Pseudobdellovibrionaceae bacterium]|nr:LysM peptidoglycan-binding domain-containing protein [Pseudobdellovibrionaceae bacterium]